MILPFYNTNSSANDITSLQHKLISKRYYLFTTQTHQQTILPLYNTIPIFNNKKEKTFENIVGKEENASDHNMGPISTLEP